MDIINSIDEYLLKDSYNADFFQLYAFTTENIDGYMQYFNLRDNSLLTTGSSCDQTINASLAGCDDITVCDICPLTKYFYYLKLAALLVLDREDFLGFLCKKVDKINFNKKFLSKSTFNKIRNTIKSLDYESYYIWEYLFNTYDIDTIEKLFRKDINDLESIVYCNRYLKNNNNYNKARKLIMNTKVIFVVEDITKFSTNKKYGNIWLSNVPHYLDDENIEYMTNNSIRLLDNNGKILLCYFWNTDMTIKGFQINYFSNVEAEKIKVPGISVSDRNSILVYTKK